jgi:phage gp36-like protein
MAYCTKQNMIDRFGELELIQLTDRANPGVIDDTVITQAISDAGAEIDGYLNRYSLPLANVPSNLVRMACDISRFYLYDDAMTDSVQTRYDSCIKYLIAVAKGLITLPPDINGVVIEEATGSAVFSSYAPVMGIDNY